MQVTETVPVTYKQSLQEQVRCHTLSNAELAYVTFVIHIFNDVKFCQLSKALHQKPN